MYLTTIINWQKEDKRDNWRLPERDKSFKCDTFKADDFPLVAAEEEQILQDDPCLAKSKVVGDVQYCDRYWECEFGQPELYDCPNGLVWVGKNQGIADGCDYPWRHTNICKDKDLASKYDQENYC